MDDKKQNKQPEWLQKFNEIFQEANVKIQQFQEKINLMSKADRHTLEYNPPGVPPSFSLKHHDRQMVEFYKGQIEEVKKEAHEKCSVILKSAGEKEISERAEEIQIKMEAISPEDKMARQKDLDASQEYLLSQKDKHNDLAKNSWDKNISEEKENNISDSRSEANQSFYNSLLYTQRENGMEITSKDSPEKKSGNDKTLTQAKDDIDRD